MRKRHTLIKAVTLSALLSFIPLLGCTPAEETEAITGLQTALTDLSANRSLTEQFVRALKTDGNPEDPAYAHAMDS